MDRKPGIDGWKGIDPEERRQIAMADPMDILREIYEDGEVLRRADPIRLNYLLLRRKSIYDGMGHEAFTQLLNELYQSKED